MSNFYLTHNTSIDALNIILKSGFLISQSQKEIKAIKKTKAINNTKKNKLVGGDLGGDHQFIYLSLVPKNNISEYYKNNQNIYDTTLLLDADLLLKKKFVYNNTWNYGEITEDSVIYDGKKLTLEKLDNILDNIYKNRLFTKLSNGDIFYINGEFLIKTRISLSKYLKYIYIEFQKGHKYNKTLNISYDVNPEIKYMTDKLAFDYNPNKLSSLLKIIKNTDKYMNVQIIIYKTPRIKHKTSKIKKDK